jgi:hypothetical protein
MERQLDPAGIPARQAICARIGADAANTKQIRRPARHRRRLADASAAGRSRGDGRWHPAERGPGRAGIAVNRGIVVDAQMRTSDPIYALGNAPR